MRLNDNIEEEEVLYRSSDDGENENDELVLSSRKSVAVGYALTSKKAKSFLQPKFERLARNKGIHFVEIDPHRPLSEQGPFDIVLQKKPYSGDYGGRTTFGEPYTMLSGKEWRQILESTCSFDHESSCACLRSKPHDLATSVVLPVLPPGVGKLVDFNLLTKTGAQDYRTTHPEVTVLDPPDAIQQLRNRQYMLQDVADLNLSNSYGQVGVPKQLVITKDAASIPDAVTVAGLMLPLVAKPLVNDGSTKSHQHSLAYDQLSLQKLEPPLVLQEFVNHGGVLFKVYIVGEAIKVVRRFSLPNVGKRELSNKSGVFRVPRVSCAAASAEEADLDPGIAELPPRPLLEKLAKELRRRLGLRLFNLDMIREHGSQNHFYVIDINYFPGYGKMPEYEQIFTDFLLSLVQNKYTKCTANS